jgi:hypothetical protein
MMESARVRVFSLILKIWVEDPGRSRWHGQITHIPSGEQHYVNSVADAAFIVDSYLEELGIRPERYVRVRQWFHRLTQR